ncbi:MAG: hypothetical protein QOG51_965 [Verrucomicrobiota bacterium]|jgi:hypothetical protein
MDEMKRAGEIDDLLRRVAKQRDKLLSEEPVLSPARGAVLADFLAHAFSVERLLREESTKRDELLRHRLEIPASVESNLRGLAVIEGMRGGIRRPHGAATWLRLFRSPLGGLLAACVMITAAILFFGSAGTPSRRNAQNFPQAPRAQIESEVILEADPFTRKTAIGPFNLNTNEPASLQAAFSASSGVYSANANEARLGLRLDLPVRAILTEDGFARTP